MKSQKNILIAFVLNLVFSLFEFAGGVLTGSVAIVSDAVHDLGDAASIGLSLFLENKSKRQPDAQYTYGYARYSVLGGLVTTAILLFGSLAVIYNAVIRLFHPTPIHYEGMILFALVGAAVNFAAAWFTRNGNSVNQKAVNLHMLEDVLGWLAVLAGAVVMRFTDLAFLDPLLSIGVALYILIHAAGNLQEIIAIVMEKIPEGICVDDVQDHIREVDGVLDVHHLHIWTLDGHNGYATMHIVTDSDGHQVKAQVRQALAQLGIPHATLELEQPGEPCPALTCPHTERHEEAHHHH